jgi:hypothetical protein
MAFRKVSTTAAPPERVGARAEEPAPAQPAGRPGHG